MVGINHRCPMDSVSFDIPSLDSPPPCLDFFHNITGDGSPPGGRGGGGPKIAQYKDPLASPLPTCGKRGGACCASHCLKASKATGNEFCGVFGLLKAARVLCQLNIVSCGGGCVGPIATTG